MSCIKKYLERPEFDRLPTPFGRDGFATVTVSNIKLKPRQTIDRGKPISLETAQRLVKINA